MATRATAWGAYKAIADALRTRIANGDFPPGAALPSESELCAEFHVARNTLRRALDQLSAEGLIAALPGRGRVVIDCTQGSPSTQPQYRRIADDLRSMIESGALKSGDPMPSEAVLAERYSTARGTARHALAELQGAGLVTSIHGKGRFVR